MTPFETASWITVTSAPVTFEAGGTKEIPFSISVPTNAFPGSHFGGIFVDFRPQGRTETGASVGYRVGSIVIVKIPGETIEEAFIREFSTGKLLFGKADVPFTVRVENKGNTLVRPRGVLDITNMFGKKASSIVVNDAVAAVFPGTDRAFPVSWKSDEFEFGRYDAVASLLYGEEGKKTISAALSFWVLPLEPIAWILGVTLGLTLLGFFIVKRHIRNKLREAGIVSGKSVSTRGGGLSRLTVTILFLVLFILVFLGVLFLLLA